MPELKKGEIRIEPGRPLKFYDLDENSPKSSADSTSLDHAMGRAIVAYTKAARNLLEGRYAAQKELAPPHLRERTNISVLRCTDGVLVRYDPCSEEKGKLIGGRLDSSLAATAPVISDQLVHFPEDPKTYVPTAGGIEFALNTTDVKTGITTTPLKFRQFIYGTASLPSGFRMPAPSTRPPCFVSVSNEVDIHLQGEFISAESSDGSVGTRPQQFLLTHSRFKLPVGWKALEIYPLLGEEYWKPEYAETWAELDLLAAIAQRNTLAMSLQALDARGAARKYYAKILDEFESLLTGPEEPAHQFLKSHPEILCPTHEKFWSKLSFGDHKSDFVFVEPYNDYELVEIEAPIREIFRKDGQQREELTHAMNQIMDWIQFITNNKQEVEQKLVGISTNPRTLIVIGRSAALTAENREKLQILQALHNKLRILTYDDVIAIARANIERILGPLGFGGQNFDVYYY